MRKPPTLDLPPRSLLRSILCLGAAAALGAGACAVGDEIHNDAAVEGTGGTGVGVGVGGAPGPGGNGVAGANGSGGTIGPGGMTGTGGRSAGAGGSIGTGGTTTAAGGRTGAAGTTGSGVTTVPGTGGAAPGVGGFTGVCAAQASTATRPQLTAAQAANDTILKYLAQFGAQGALTTDNWNPTAGLGSVTAFPADLVVAADGSGTQRTVQAALTAATGTARRYILVKPGTYRETITINTATPITIYGAGDPTQVVIVNGVSAAAGGGTAQSATMTVRNNGFQIMNLTISNDFPAPATGTNIQAVALYTTGDKIVMQNVRLHGFQDTLYIDSPSATTVARVYIKGSFIEGDTDFIFGRSTTVIDGSTINYLSSRKGTGAGVHLAPSTSVANDFGFLVSGCTFSADAAAPANRISLGRSWDQSSTVPTPNGQAVIRESTMGAHINRAAPWAAAATSSRAFSATGNRFFEYCNSGPGAAP
jgi:pectinesterase